MGGALFAAAGSLLWLLLARRRAARRAALDLPALEAELAAAPSPFAAALLFLRHAARSLQLPPAALALLVYDAPGDCRRGYVVRGDAEAPPPTAGCMELLPGGWLLADKPELRDAEGARVLRLRAHIPGARGGRGRAAAAGALVALLQAGEAAAPAALRLARELVGAAGLAAALGPRAGSAGSGAAPPPPPQPPQCPCSDPAAFFCVEPSWRWDVFAGLPLRGGLHADTEVEGARQFARARGAAVADDARSCCTAAARERLAEERLQRAAVEMLCGARTQALLAPALPPLPRGAAEDFVRALRGHYHANAFHNFYHAAAVLHAAWLLAGAPGVARALGPAGVLALLRAARAHDAGHPGHSNALERALATPLALRHGAEGTLERHHAAVLARLLAEPAPLLARLAPAERARVRELCGAAILHTDMATHGDLVRALEACAAGGGAPARPLLLAALLHAADLGGQAYAPLATPFNWGARIRAEFRSQVALERALRLPPTLAMRGLASDASYAQSQVQFLDELAAPLWRALHAIVGGLEEPLANIAATRAAFAAQA